jgi:hypothetical protein
MAVDRLLTDATLYEQDPHAWYFRQAALLRAGRIAEADAIHIAEELEDLGRSEAKELRSSLRLICSHLLKWQRQREKRSRSWMNTIERERRNAALSLRENPSLKSKVADLFVDAYDLARWEAAEDTNLPVDVFPAEPPFTLDEVRQRGWLPPE